MPNLKATERDIKQNLAQLRADGFIPAVFYGSKDKGAPIAVNVIEFKKVWKEVGETSTVELDTPAGKVNAMVYDVQVDPVRSEVIHVDFYVVEKGQKVEVEVPLTFEGVAPAEKDLGGVMIKVLHVITVEGEPQNIPDEFVINLEALTKMDSQILVKDIKIPKGIELKIDLEEVVAAMSEATEEVDEPVEEMDMSAIEVEQKGKKEEDKEGSESTETPEK